MKYDKTLIGPSWIYAVVEPKYDGTNIAYSYKRGWLRGKKGKPINEGIKRILDQAMTQEEQRMVVDWAYDMAEFFEIPDPTIFFEVGGRRYSPAGYTGSWSRDWDFRVIDVYLRDWVRPRHWERLRVPFRDRWTPYTEIDSVTALRMILLDTDVIREWLSRYPDHEGFVLKVWGRWGFWDRWKYKHDQLRVGPDELSDSEILTALVEAGALQFEEARRVVAEEARKHGKKPPSGDRLAFLLRKAKTFINRSMDKE